MVHLCATISSDIATRFHGAGSISGRAVPRRVSFLLTFSASFYLTSVATNVSAGVSCGVTNVLRILGHDFEVQPALEIPDGTKRPDYVFSARHLKGGRLSVKLSYPYGSEKRRAP